MRYADFGFFWPVQGGGYQRKTGQMSIFPTTIRYRRTHFSRRWPSERVENSRTILNQEPVEWVKKTFCEFFEKFEFFSNHWKLSESKVRVFWKFSKSSSSSSPSFLYFEKVSLSSSISFSTDQKVSPSIWRVNIFCKFPDQ